MKESGLIYFLLILLMLSVLIVPSFYEVVDVEFEYEITDIWHTNGIFGIIYRFELDNETVITVDDFDYHNYEIGDIYIIVKSELVRR